MTPTSTRRSELSGLRVVVSERSPKDVAVISPIDGDRTLVLRKGQTRENATDRLLEKFPKEHIDDVRRFVRTHLPDAPSFESILATGAPPEWIAPPVENPPKAKVSGTTKLVSTAAVGVLCAATLLGYSILRDMTGSLLDQSEFQSISQAAGLECTIVDRSNAVCRNPHMGTSWKVTATPSEGEAEPNLYRFVSGDKMAVVQVFSSEDARVDYPVNAAYARLWPFRTSRDRVAISATDAPVIAALAGAVDVSVLRGQGRDPDDVHPSPNVTLPSQARPTYPGTPHLRETETPWPATTSVPMLVGDRPQRPQEPAERPAPSSSDSTGTPAPPKPAEEPEDSAPAPAQPSSSPTTDDGSQNNGALVQLPTVTLDLRLGI